jgi:RNA polymerase sigma-70 factor (ECF subfamily)
MTTEWADAERAVLEEAARGDFNAAVERAVRLFGPGVSRYLLGAIGERADAEDAFGEWQLALIDALPRFEQRATLRTFLFALARHAAAHAIDARRRRTAMRADVGTSRLCGIAQEVFVETLRHLPPALEQQALTANADLDAEERGLLVLYAGQELSWKEVVAVLGVDGAEPGAEAARLRKRFERLKEKLRERAARDGLVRWMDDARTYASEVKPR